MKFFLPLVFVLSMVFNPSAMAQEESAYLKKTFVQNGSSMPYRILLPKDFSPKKKYPLILVLHGSGERGNDNEAQLVHGSDLFLKTKIRDEFPALVVFPQCASESSWSKIDVKGEFPDREFVFFENAEPTPDMELLEGLLKQLKKNYKINRRQMYVGGLSMGGMGTFELVKRNPKMFAAAFPICGGANPLISKRLRHPEWWVFHGDADDVVAEKYSNQMVKAMGQEGITVKYTVYARVGHNSWDNAFAEPNLVPWLFSKSR